MSLKLGVMTGGGDAPGLNAVIRAFVKCASLQHDWEVWGITDTFNGLMSRPLGVRRLTPRSCQGLLQRGGTILGTTNRSDPFAIVTASGATEDRSQLVADAFASLGWDGLISIGGDGTQKISWRLMQEHGIPVVAVPKTIDNDLEATDYTFGFQSAVAVATDALDRLHTTAESHDRVMFLEVMGRDAGHIALEAGLAGGADVILLPELPYSPEKVASKILRRRSIGRPFSIIVVAEGALPARADGAPISPAQRKEALRAGGGAAAIAMSAVSAHVDAEMRATVLGHLQRGGSPVPFDRILATRFGVGAARLVSQGRWGEMVRLKHGVVDGVPIAEAVATNRGVDLGGELLQTARAVGIELGA